MTDTIAIAETTRFSRTLFYRSVRRAIAIVALSRVAVSICIQISGGSLLRPTVLDEVLFLTVAAGLFEFDLDIRGERILVENLGFWRGAAAAFALLIAGLGEVLFFLVLRLVR